MKDVQWVGDFSVDYQRKLQSTWQITTGKEIHCSVVALTFFLSRKNWVEQLSLGTKLFFSAKLLGSIWRAGGVVRSHSHTDGPKAVTATRCSATARTSSNQISVVLLASGQLDDGSGTFQASSCYIKVNLSAYAYPPIRPHLEVALLHIRSWTFLTTILCP